MNVDLDSKISFLSGGTFTIMMTGPIYEGAIVLLMGIIGGFGGVLGKYLFYTIKEYIDKRKGSK